MSTMLENASEVLFVLGILFTVAGVIFREIRRAKDPYKGRAVATAVSYTHLTLPTKRIV